ncbi:GNAT family N-acetyltransferase [uncultured Microbacterium sp.]|uniref:GNAT family N-acetyltransferase n=1 Tax=uncultured Microbacterium sp. TaxID=191216 RepID=UPI0025DB10B1|nr:GNAT family N-acetyltransferase [uncultured Microbacterium sp.]
MDLGSGIRLRPLRPGDGAPLATAYRRNRAHLAPWEPARTEDFYTASRQTRAVSHTLREVSVGRSAAYVLSDDEERIVGRVNLSDVVRGAFDSCHLGYWIDATLTGRGLAQRAVAEVARRARDEWGLHRIQAATLLHNAASQRVLRATGFSEIGCAPRYLRIAGEWQDHLLFQRILADSPS